MTWFYSFTHMTFLSGQIRANPYVMQGMLLSQPGHSRPACSFGELPTVSRARGTMRFLDVWSGTLGGPVKAIATDQT